MSVLDKIRRIFIGESYNGDLAGWGGENYSQKNVNQDTILAISAVFACARVIAGSIASLPIGVYDRDKTGDKVDKSDSDTYRLLHTSPNADMTAFDFWFASIALLLLWGNVYILKTYTGTGANRRVVAMEILENRKISIRKNQDGSRTYIFQDRKKDEYSEDQIMHLRGFTLDGKNGVSVIRAGANSFGNAMSQEESAGKLYANGMRPGGAIKMPQVLKDEQRAQMRKSITDQVGGVARSGGMIVLEGGMEFQALSMPPEDAQMIQSRGFSIEEICRWFGVPPVLIGHNEKSTSWGTGIEQLNLGFLTYTLSPIIKKIEQQIKKSIIPSGSPLFAEFAIEGFLRADAAGRASLYSSFTQNGIMTRAEARKKENLPYMPGTDELTVQSALVPLNMLGQPKESAEPARTIEDSAKL